MSNLKSNKTTRLRIHLSTLIILTTLMGVILHEIVSDRDVIKILRAEDWILIIISIVIYVVFAVAALEWSIFRIQKRLEIRKEAQETGAQYLSLLSQQTDSSTLEEDNDNCGSPVADRSVAPPQSKAMPSGEGKSP